MPIRTIEINITSRLSEEDKQVILSTIEDSVKVFDMFLKLSKEHKSVSYMTLHKYGYHEARRLCQNSNADIIQASAKQALACMKTWNTEHPKKKWQLTAVKHGSQYPLTHNNISRRGYLTTFSTNNHRIRMMHDIPEWFDKNYPEKELRCGCVHVKNNQFFISMSYKTPEVSYRTEGKVVGIDRGLYHHYATSEGVLYDSKHIHRVERKNSFLRQQLQLKGTRSAKRHLRKLSGREKRFKQDVDHCLTKQLASAENVKCYVLEDLSGIRNNKHSKRLNRWLHQWSSYRFEQFLRYKCEAKGIQVVTVNPKFTSQECSVCHTINSEHRHKNHYKCSICGNYEHADINAAKVIRNRYLLTPAGKSGCIQPPKRVENIYAIKNS